MGSTAEEKAALPVGVIAAADTTGLTGILYRGTASASNASITITPEIQGKWLAQYAKSVDVQVAFSLTTTAPTLVYGQDVVAGTGHVAAGMTLPAGAINQFLIPPKALRMSFIAEAATGDVEFYVLEGLSGGK